MSEKKWTAKAEAWEADEEIIVVSNGERGEIVGGTVSRRDAPIIVRWLNQNGGLYYLHKLMTEIRNA